MLACPLFGATAFALTLPAVAEDCSVDSATFPLAGTQFSTTAISSIRVADMDGDGQPDVVTTALNNVSILRSAGNGRLELHDTQATGDFAFAIDIGDIDGDGHPDVLIGENHENRVKVFRNDGTGHLAAAETYHVGDNPLVLRLSDVDGDGDLDALTLNTIAATFSVMINDGGGEFTVRAPEATLAEPRDLSLGDLDGDGDPDLLITGGMIAQPIVYRNDGSGVFTQWTLLPLGVTTSMSAIIDIDQDGDHDLVYSTLVNLQFSESTLTLGRNDGTGQFTLSHIVTPTMAETFVFDDFNNDGAKELIVTYVNNHHAQIFGFNGSSLTMLGQLPAVSRGLVAIDLNADGRLDLASSPAEPGVDILRNRCGDCIGDIDGDGTVGFNDLTLILAAWGPCVPCAANLDWSELVDLSDLLVVLARWGDC